LSEAKEFYNKNEPMVMKIDRGVDAFLDGLKDMLPKNPLKSLMNFANEYGNYSVDPEYRLIANEKFANSSKNIATNAYEHIKNNPTSSAIFAVNTILTTTVDAAKFADSFDANYQQAKSDNRIPEFTGYSFAVAIPAMMEVIPIGRGAKAVDFIDEITPSNRIKANTRLSKKQTIKNIDNTINSIEVSKNNVIKIENSLEKLGYKKQHVQISTENGLVTYSEVLGDLGSSLKNLKQDISNNSSKLNGDNGDLPASTTAKIQELISDEIEPAIKKISLDVAEIQKLDDKIQTLNKKITRSKGEILDTYGSANELNGFSTLNTSKRQEMKLQIKELGGDIKKTEQEIKQNIKQQKVIIDNKFIFIFESMNDINIAASEVKNIKINFHKNNELELLTKATKKQISNDVDNIINSGKVNVSSIDSINKSDYNFDDIKTKINAVNISLLKLKKGIERGSVDSKSTGDFVKIIKGHNGEITESVAQLTKTYNDIIELDKIINNSEMPTRSKNFANNKKQQLVIKLGEFESDILIHANELNKLFN